MNKYYDPNCYLCQTLAFMPPEDPRVQEHANAHAPSNKVADDPLSMELALKGEATEKIIWSGFTDEQKQLIASVRYDAVMASLQQLDGSAEAEVALLAGTDVKAVSRHGGLLSSFGDQFDIGPLHFVRDEEDVHIAHTDDCGDIVLVGLESGDVLAISTDTYSDEFPVPDGLLELKQYLFLFLINAQSTLQEQAYQLKQGAIALHQLSRQL